MQKQICKYGTSCKLKSCKKQHLPMEKTQVIGDNDNFESLLPPPNPSNHNHNQHIQQSNISGFQSINQNLNQNLPQQNTFQNLPNINNNNNSQTPNPNNSQRINQISNKMKYNGNSKPDNQSQQSQNSHQKKQPNFSKQEFIIDNQSQQSKKSQQKKNQMCRYGDKCTLKQCKYLHGGKLEQNSNSFQTGQFMPESNESLSSQTKKGKFIYDKSGQFLPESNESLSTQAKKKQSCKFGAKCNLKNCKFQHPKSKIAKAPKDRKKIQERRIQDKLSQFDFQKPTTDIQSNISDQDDIFDLFDGEEQKYTGVFDLQKQQYESLEEKSQEWIKNVMGQILNHLIGNSDVTITAKNMDIKIEKYIREIQPKLAGLIGIQLELDQEEIQQNEAQQKQQMLSAMQQQGSVVQNLKTQINVQQQTIQCENIHTYMKIVNKWNLQFAQEYSNKIGVKLGQNYEFILVSQDPQKLQSCHDKINNIRLKIKQFAFSCPSIESANCYQKLIQSKEKLIIKALKSKGLTLQNLQVYTGQKFNQEFTNFLEALKASKQIDDQQYKAYRTQSYDDSVDVNEVLIHFQFQNPEHGQPIFNFFQNQCAMRESKQYIHEIEYKFTMDVQKLYGKQMKKIVEQFQPKHFISISFERENREKDDEEQIIYKNQVLVTFHSINLLEQQQESLDGDQQDEAFEDISDQFVQLREKKFEYLVDKVHKKKIWEKLISSQIEDQAKEVDVKLNYIQHKVPKTYKSNNNRTVQEYGKIELQGISQNVDKINECIIQEMKQGTYKSVEQKYLTISQFSDKLYQNLTPQSQIWSLIQQEIKDYVKTFSQDPEYYKLIDEMSLSCFQDKKNQAFKLDLVHKFQLHLDYQRIMNYLWKNLLEQHELSHKILLEIYQDKGEKETNNLREIYDRLQVIGFKHDNESQNSIILSTKSVIEEIKMCEEAIKCQNKRISQQIDFNPKAKDIYGIMVSKFQSLPLVQEKKVNYSIRFEEQKIFAFCQKAFAQKAVMQFKELQDQVYNSFKKQDLTDLHEFQINTLVWQFQQKQQKLMGVLKKTRSQFSWRYNKQKKEQQKQSQNSLCQLIYNNKTKLLCTNTRITKIQADIIVNLCNEHLIFDDKQKLFGVAQDISNNAGQGFINQCNQWKEQYGDKIPQDKILICESYKLTNCQKICNIVSQFYTSQDSYQQIEKHIKKSLNDILDYCDKNGYSTVAIPLIGGGAGNHLPKQIAQYMIKSILSYLQKKENSNLREIFISEIDQNKIEEAIIPTMKSMKKDQKEEQYILKYQWQWRNDKRGYDDYQGTQNEAIDRFYEELILSQDFTKTLQIKIARTSSPGTHIVDLEKMTVRNIKLGIIQTLTEVENLYYRDDECLGAQTSEFIDYNKQDGQTKIELFLNEYEIRSDEQGNLTQFNTKTNFPRKIQKVPLADDQLVEMQKKMKQLEEFRQDQLLEYQELEKEEMNKQLQEENQRDKKIISIQSIEFQQLKQDILQYLESQTETKTIKIPYQIPQSQLEKIQKRVQYIDPVNHEQTQISKDSTITLKGIKYDVEQLEEKINDIINNPEKYIDYPSEWESYQDQNCKLYQLQNQDEEFQQIQEGFLQSQPNAQILKVERIQNKNLYQNYYQECQQMYQAQTKAGYELKSNKQMLYHGTYKTPPETIYEGHTAGLDYSYSNDKCMWGPGGYYSTTSKYSNGYAYNTSDSLKMIIFEVELGEPAQIPRNNMLRKPPLRPIEGDQKQLGYDSVGGITQGVQIYVLYGMSVNRSYPKYLIEYKK